MKNKPFLVNIMCFIRFLLIGSSTVFFLVDAVIENEGSLSLYILKKKINKVIFFFGYIGTVSLCSFLFCFKYKFEIGEIACSLFKSRGKKWKMREGRRRTIYIRIYTECSKSDIKNGKKRKRRKM